VLAKPSDETIAQDIEKRVSTEPRSQQAQVKVEAKRGNVTLTGRAKTEAPRQEIEKIARDEP
jgi:osmotically-inducible protein OsmY